jgi:MFS family permease
VGVWLRSTFSSFAVPEYRVLWLGTTIAMLTFMMSWTVQSVVAFDLAGTNTAVGIVSLGSGAAMLLLGPFGGVFADRVSKRRLLFAGQVLIGTVYVVLAVLVLTDRITILLLVLTTFVMGLSFSIVGPVRQAYVGEIAPMRLLANAVAMNSLSQMFSRIVSPAVAGILIGVAVVGPGGTFIVMAVMMSLVLVTIRMLPDVTPRPTEGRSVFRDFREGIAYVGSEPKLRFLATIFILVVLIGFPFQTILPGLLEHELGRPARTVGFMLGVSAIGGFASGIALAGLAGSRFAMGLQLALGLTFGASLIGLAIAPTFELALVAVFVMGLGSGGFQMLNQSQLMTTTAPAFHGRVMSLQMLAWGGMGLIAFPLGIVADSQGERAVLAGMGVAVSAVVVLAIVGYRIVVPSRPPPEVVPAPVSPAFASTGGATLSANGANGANGNGHRPETPVPLSPALAARSARAPALAGPSPRAPLVAAANGAASASASPRRRVGRDFMNSRGGIVGRDYM